MNFVKFKLVETHNGFVIDSYMNLFARVTAKKIFSKMPDVIMLSETSMFDDSITEVNQLAKEAFDLMDMLDFGEAIAKIKKIILIGN